MGFDLIFYLEREYHSFWVGLDLGPVWFVSGIGIVFGFGKGLKKLDLTIS